MVRVRPLSMLYFDFSAILHLPHVDTSHPASAGALCTGHVSSVTQWTDENGVALFTGPELLITVAFRKTAKTEGVVSSQSNGPCVRAAAKASRRSFAGGVWLSVSRVRAPCSRIS